MHLTRRGRALLAALMWVAAVLASVMLGLETVASARAADAGAPPRALPKVTEVVVRPGQTLWSIAGQLEPATDPRVVVEEIVALNALGSRTDIQPGERLWVPRG